MKLRQGDAWMTGPEYGRTLKGMTINLLVKNIDKALEFQTKVLMNSVVYSDPDFAVVRGCGSEWMLHADHTYEKNPIYAETTNTAKRGIGIELRLHGLDPDKAVERAHQLGYHVVAEAVSKDAHRMREAYIADADGYTWVPDVCY